MESKQLRTISLTPLDISQESLYLYAEKLIEYAESYGIQLGEQQAVLCVEHFLYVLQVNEYINLTRITNIDDGLLLHVLDSLLFSLCVPSHATSFLDMGSGPGYPGIPISILTGMSGVLLDSVNKKIQFDNVVCKEIGLSNLTAVHDRIESYATHKYIFDVVMARALAPLPVLIEYASPFLSMGGILVVSKGNISHEEIQSGESAALICGFELKERLSLALPLDYGHREILAYERVGNASIKLPRPVGTAKRNPLA